MSKPASELNCPACGYYCLGTGGFGCIDKPKLVEIETNPPTNPSLKDKLFPTKLGIRGTLNGHDDLWYSYSELSSRLREIEEASEQNILTREKE